MMRFGRGLLGLEVGIVALLIVYAVVVYTGYAVEKQMKKDIENFVSALDIIQENYYKELDEKDLVYGALKGICFSLDPHSQFMDEAVYKEMKAETEGEFGGLGIEIAIRDQYLTVVAPLEDTPAFKVGLQAGDRIVQIEDEPTKDLSLIEAVRKLRGKPGTTVNITVMRPGTAELLPFSITRANIKIQSIKDASILEDGIGYVRLTQFQEHTGKDLERALKELKEQGMEALILDLRNNPGGLLQVAIKVADEFIGEGRLIVYTKSRHGTQNIEFKSHQEAAYADFPLVVLVNKGSASGSEIVAGAVQDWKRGVILGSNTFGKGSVQSVLPLREGSALRLTTAKYFTPEGRCIEKVGVEPDIVIEVSDEDEIKRLLKKRLEKMVSEKPAGEEPGEEEKELKKLGDVKDVQLERAVDLAKGLLVYTRAAARSEQQDNSGEQ
jgi:carboxyl-terminal processing protease